MSLQRYILGSSDCILYDKINQVRKKIRHQKSPADVDDRGHRTTKVGLENYKSDGNNAIDQSNQYSTSLDSNKSEAQLPWSG